MTRTRWLILLVIAISAAYIGGRCTLNATGMCLDTYRYITDDQLIDAARRQAYRMQDGKYLSSTLNAGRSFIRYDNYDDFIKQNPRCCTLVPSAREGFSPSFYNKINGVGRAVVKVDYKSSIQHGNTIPQTETAYFFITNCGRAW